MNVNRIKPAYDSSTITTTTATTTTKHDQSYTNSGGGFRSLPPILSSGNGMAGGNQRRKISKRKVYDPAQWPCALLQDTIEQDRLVAQHYLLRTVFGSDHHAPVQSLLSQQLQQRHHHHHHHSVFGSGGEGVANMSSPTTSASSSLCSTHDNNNNNNGGSQSDHGPVVLDVGCGLGQWSMEMATTYPNSTFIGLDILPTFPKDIKPRNCYFLQVNVKRLPLPFADQSVDFIYQRDLNWGLGQDDWYPLIKEYLRILKPGGWIELVEADLETKSSLEKECAMNDKLLEGFSRRRQDPFVARRLPTMLAIHGFRRVESHFQSLPLGWKHNNPTYDADHHQHVTNDSHDNSSTPGRQVQAIASQYLFYLRSLGPWLRLVMGLSQSKYIDYVDQLPLEWEQAQTYVNWHCATAQKPYE
ncbi:S-adenosyl-L-methionine-dependent methyltransferase [Absidia repens]|uniref:S-adenosyl-L-methionine-dependent methyltransferase n=1 Tax=Absidia repens TaxID=90262 RepID=A0A1X2IQT4_9FUNG|nr:S-adenosyl-L-methionine-dependent methyltransferase [Absidia repens]